MGLQATARAEDVVEWAAPGWWVTLLGGMVLTAVLAFDAGAYAAWERNVTAALSQGMLRTIFWAAAAVHVGEACYAWSTARAAGLQRSAAGWAVQTLAIGFASLRLLRRRVRGAAPRRRP